MFYKIYFKVKGNLTRISNMNIYFETYGCTSNKSDTRKMEALAKNSDHKIVDDIEKSDLVVINTCVVIEKTENRMLNRIKELKNLKLVVAGCLSKVNQEGVKEIDSDIKLISPQDLSEFAEVVGDKKKDLDKWEILNERDGVEGQIQISEGCKGNCSYCITKFARGNLRKFPKNSIVNEVRNLVNEGVKEIQLTAQDTSTYGLDGKDDLYSLVEEINGIEGEFRIRIGMMNPNNVVDKKDRLIKVFELDKVYNFLHLPVQSGSNKVLRDMQRGYSVRDFKEIVKVYREKNGGLLSTDVIAGFPSENENDFEKTVSLIQDIEPEILNITRYSPRPGTKAAESDEIISQEKKNRSKKLTKLKKKIGKKRRKRYLGKTREVLVLKEGKEDTMIGKDPDYNTVVIEDNVCIGDFVDVEISDFSFTYLVGKLEV
ncbi:threonylcarbamoyladenosine tRNA methylthiotransferase [archaeon SCG-AAA382B04]|nr:threonylcarbamoyladenosine tRNA methylthiotransferase [archaeon SCG-AAA382B04]